MIKKFFRSENGNIAMMFGLLLVPLVLGAGVGLDMVRAGVVRSEIAEASDAGLLAAARASMQDGTLTKAQAEAIARKYFDSNRNDGANVIIDSFSFNFDTTNDTYTLSVSGRVETTILGITGQKYMPFNVDSEATVAPPRSLEVALVLDNTYSMTANNKMDTLKTAADDLVNTIMADIDNEVKVGIVPFSQYVNIGLSRRSETWLDVADDSSDTHTDPNYCYNTYPDSNQTCTSSPGTCNRTKDGVSESYSCNKNTCTGSKGTPVQVCEERTWTTTETWSGCVGSRNTPFNVRDEQYDVRPVPGLRNIGCAQEILPLTTTKATVKSNIQSMYVQGDQTYIPGGLVWGYRMLSDVAPLTEGISYTKQQDERGIKAVVLMTDGVNTRSASFPHHNTNSRANADKLIGDLCDEVKGKGITIYTIAFEVTDAAVKTILEDCATSPSDYYDATDATKLSGAFEAIGKSLTELALTK